MMLPIAPRSSAVSGRHAPAPRPGGFLLLALGLAPLCASACATVDTAAPARVAAAIRCAGSHDAAQLACFEALPPESGELAACGYVIEDARGFIGWRPVSTLPAGSLLYRPGELRALAEARLRDPGFRMTLLASGVEHAPTILDGGEDTLARYARGDFGAGEARATNRACLLAMARELSAMKDDTLAARRRERLAIFENELGAFLDGRWDRNGAPAGSSDEAAAARVVAAIEEEAWSSRSAGPPSPPPACQAQLEAQLDRADEIQSFRRAMSGADGVTRRDLVRAQTLVFRSAPSPAAVGGPRARASNAGIEACRERLVMSIDAWLPTRDAELAGAELAARDAAEARRAADEAAEQLVALRRRIEPLVRGCRSAWSSETPVCASTPGLSDIERAECRRACAEAAEEGARAGVEGALHACIAQYELDGFALRCTAQKPAGSNYRDAALEALLDGCSRRCRVEGPEARKSRLRVLTSSIAR